MENITIENLYDLTETIAAELFTEAEYPWEVLPRIHDFILELGKRLPEEIYEKRGEDIWVAKNAKVAPTACLNGPLIIDEEAEIRHCAFVRGNAIVGKGAVVGNSTELKNVVLFNKVQVPHYNYVGAELIGDPSVEADAEVISMVIEALKSTGLTRFQVTIGEVDYFRGLCEEAGLDEDTEKELRSCISGKNFFAAQELLEQKQIPEPYHSILLKLADMFENIESLEDAKSLVKNERSLQAIARLEKLKKRLEQYGVAEYITFDLGMLSKYQYYTGVVFKAYTYGIGDAVVKGGRYDNLLRKFGKDTAAIGFVIVIDDLLEALSRQKVVIDVPASGKILYYRAGDETDYLAKLAEAAKLRKEGIPTVLSPEITENEEADQ